MRKLRFLPWVSCTSKSHGVFGSSRRINGDIILPNREISTREGKEMMKKMGARVCLCVLECVYVCFDGWVR